MSRSQNPVYLVYKGDYTTQLYSDFNHYKDPYEQTDTMACHKGLFHVAQLSSFSFFRSMLYCINN